MSKPKSQRNIVVKTTKKEEKKNLAPIRAMRGALKGHRQLLRGGHPLYQFVLSKRPELDRKSTPGFHLKGGESLAVKYRPVDDEAIKVVSSSESMASAMVDPTATYEFRLAQSFTLATNTSGSLASSFEWDPAVVGGSDWTAMTSLFNQVRLVQARMHFLPCNTFSYSGSAQTSAICSNISGYAGTPASITSVVSMPDAIMLSHNVSACATPQAVNFRSPMRPNRLWAAVGTPAPAIDTGCYGTFWICHDSLTYGANAERIFSGYIELIIELRGRA